MGWWAGVGDGLWGKWRWGVGVKGRGGEAARQFRFFERKQLFVYFEGFVLDTVILPPAWGTQGVFWSFGCVSGGSGGKTGSGA